jgi:hypothetical protein
MKRLLLALTLTVASSAQAEPTIHFFVDGNSLLSACTDPAPNMQSYCLGYIEGVADWLNVLYHLDNGNGCVPPEVTGIQIRDVVLNHLRTHPQDRHWEGSTLTVIAINKAWCPAKPPQVDLQVPPRFVPNYRQEN